MFYMHSFCVNIHCVHLILVFTYVGSGSPINSDDDQKMNNFIEKGTVFLFLREYFH